MKKIFLLLSIIFVSFLFTKIVSAEVSSTTEKINAIKQQISDLKETVAAEKQQAKEIIASTTLKLSGKKQELKNAIELKIGKALDAQKIKIADQFEQTIKNLNDLAERIDSRISKMDADNIDTSSSTILLETAKTKISLAGGELTNLENLLAQEIPGVVSIAEKAQRNTILKGIKTQSEKTKSAIKAARTSIIQVVAVLKGEQIIEVGATTTTESNSTTTTNQ